MSERWHKYFLDMALSCARMSKDPKTQVGAILVGPDREVRSTGFNGFPRGVADTDARLNDRDEKLSLIVHAEANAILNAARAGISTNGCEMYLLATDQSGEMWGGPPCTHCTIEIIQAGIKCVTSLPFKNGPSNWKDEVERGRKLLAEAGVLYREFSVSDTPATSE